MSTRHLDGSAGDANYAAIGRTYSTYRQPDPRIAAQIWNQLGDARHILNVGAGAGAYEPRDREVTAVEPSASMRAKRPPHLPAAIDAVAESLPFADQTFDAAMATFTVHQWKDLPAGLRELRRVTRGPVVILSCEPDEVARFWLNNYAPEVLDTEARRYPRLDAMSNSLGGRSEIMNVPIPFDCQDGFNEAYYGRPEALLDDGARLACSAWSFVSSEVVERFKKQLANDLMTGEWNRRYGHLRHQPTYEGSLRLLAATP